MGQASKVFHWQLLNLHTHEIVLFFIGFVVIVPCLNCGFEMTQTVASICWIISVFSYGISSSGDVLQLCAASAWLLANIAAVMTVKAD